MKLFAFTFTLNEIVDDNDAINALYARTGDVTAVDADGRTELQFDREAQSLDEAMRSAWADVQACGWQIQEITVKPESIAVMA